MIRRLHLGTIDSISSYYVFYYHSSTCHIMIFIPLFLLQSFLWSDDLRRMLRIRHNLTTSQSYTSVPTRVLHYPGLATLLVCHSAAQLVTFQTITIPPAIVCELEHIVRHMLSLILPGSDPFYRFCGHRLCMCSTLLLTNRRRLWVSEVPYFHFIYPHRLSRVDLGCDRF